MSGAGILWVAVVLGIVEGATEFVPVSSTGHLILVGRWLAFPPEKALSFEIFIQLGAVIAVVWHYRVRLARLAASVATDPRARVFVAKLGLAFLPSAIAGLVLHEWIERALFAPLPVAAALAVGGVAILAIDRPRLHAHRSMRPVDEVTWMQAIAIGCVQVAALWPGISRAGATIIGGLLAGLSRTAALEFSFLLAIPTLGAASIFALWTNRSALSPHDLAPFAVGLAVSFVVALATITFLLRYVRDHDLRPFGWYRLALAVAVVATVML